LPPLTTLPELNHFCLAQGVGGKRPQGLPLEERQ